MRLCVKDQRQVVGVLEASAADEGRCSEGLRSEGRPRGACRASTPLRETSESILDSRRAVTLPGDRPITNPC